MAALSYSADPSNYTPGRAGVSVDMVVLHWIDGTLDSADAVFMHPQPPNPRSAHYGIGDTEVHQYVSENDTAWHADDWQVNLRSIGIEHQGSPTIVVSEQTYQTSIAMVTSICQHYHIDPTADRQLPNGKVVKAVCGHNEVSDGGTDCPGNLDVAAMRHAVKQACDGATVVPITAPLAGPNPPRHLFTTNLEPGMQTSEVTRLQDRLKQLACFPLNIDSTGYYGTITRKAVTAFQKRWGVKPQSPAFYGYFGPLTRAKLNSLA